MMNATFCVGVMVALLCSYTAHVCNYCAHAQEKKDSSCYVDEFSTSCREGSNKGKRAPAAWLLGEPKADRLVHVQAVFERLGFNVTKDRPVDNWDVMWNLAYPFNTMRDTMTSLKPHQRVNHFPGVYHVANKLKLAMSPELSKYIPTSFRIPEDLDEFQMYAREHPDKMWVQKNVHYRGVEIKSPDEIDTDSSEELFVQEYIDNPMLIDGRKFDTTIFTIVTSLNPLRVYIIEEPGPFRICKKEYHPFDPKDTDKFVIADDFLDIWQMPSLKEMYKSGKYGFKEIFDHYMATQGMNVTQLWTDMYDIIREIFQKKQDIMLRTGLPFGSQRHFFELARTDFLLHETGKVYLMEVNMSPNLATLPGDVKKRRHVVERIIYNALQLTGIASLADINFHTSNEDVQEMLVSDRDISVFVEWCTMDGQSPDCEQLTYALCGQCLEVNERTILKDAYLEHIHRGECRRLFPPPMKREEALAWSPGNDIFGITKTADNQLMFMWFVGMCRKDITWCT